MARKSTETADPKVVVLVDPNGTEYNSNSPAEISRLHYGLGYTFRDASGYNEALADLGDDAAVAAVPSHEAPSGAVNLTDDVTVADEGSSTD